MLTFTFTPKIALTHMPNLSEENLTTSSSHYELENSYLTGSLLSCPPLLPPKKKKNLGMLL